MWLLIAIAAAVAVRILLPILRARHDPLSRGLVFEFGVRPTGPNGAWTGRDRAFSGVLSLATAGVCIGVAFLAANLAEKFPNLSTSSYIATGFMFGVALFALVALVRGLVDLLRAPFTRPWKSSGLAAPSSDSGGREA